jgi:SAM-dependent methyltransferase
LSHPVGFADGKYPALPGRRSIFDCRDGIWRFLPPDRQVYYEQFMREYQTVRQAEGRGSTDAGYYRSLPFVDLTGQFSADWQIRARSFRTFLSDVLQPMERTLQRPLRVIDLGAGNGWLSYRLAQRSHYVAAVDLIDNPFDGLGAHVYYDAAFTPVQAEFDRLPLTDSYIDLAIFNASLHYATRYETTLGEALRVLQPAGQIVILDSPSIDRPQRRGNGARARGGFHAEGRLPPMRCPARTISPTSACLI